MWRESSGKKGSSSVHSADAEMPAPYDSLRSLHPANSLRVKGKELIKIRKLSFLIIASAIT